MSEIPPFSPTEPGDGRPSQGLPFSREAEEAVLGAILVNPEVYYDVAHFLASEDFYLHRNRWIWEAFAGLHDQRRPVDLVM